MLKRLLRIMAAALADEDTSGPITINITVVPGVEAEAGRQINKALADYYRDHPKDPDPLN